MAGFIALRLTAGDPRPIEGECIACGSQGLHEISLYALGDDGPRAVRTLRYCGDCGRWPIITV